MPEAIGIDIGGTRIKAVRIDAADAIGARLERDTPDETAALVASVHQLIARLDGPGLPTGIAAPGLAARGNRAIRWMRGRLEAIEGLDWPAALDAPAAVLNDGHAAALGEAWVGAAAGHEHVLLLTLGTGVGGGVITDGRLLQGALGRAGHLGHVCLDPQGPPDIVGTPGSLEDLVGNHSVEARTGFASTADLVAAARAGDEAARRHWDATIHVLACALVSLINAFDPEVVVLGGGIAEAGEDLLFAPLRAALARHEWRPLGEAHAVALMPAALGPWAGAVGAARFATTRSETDR